LGSFDQISRICIYIGPAPNCGAYVFAPECRINVHATIVMLR